MAQQLNLCDARLRPRARPVSAWQTGAAAGVVLLATFGAARALNARAAPAAARAEALEQASVALATSTAASGSVQPADAAAPSKGAGMTAEIERLRRFDAAQRRAQAALDADVTRSRRAYADYFDALARQARASLWITGLSVSADGDAIELEGRMLDANALPDYLRRLNAEPRFRGRPFARLALNALDTPADAGSRLPFLEFALRSTAATAP